MLDKLWDLLAGWIHALAFWTIVYPYERGLIMRLGLFRKEVGPGFHWMLPFHVDYIHKENVVPRTERIAGLATTTVDGKSVGFDAIVTYRIANLQKAVFEIDDLKDAIADSCAGTIGTALSNANWEQIRHGDAIDALTKECRKNGWKWGVEIQNVQLAGLALVKNIRLSISAAPHANNMSTFNIVS